MRLVLACIALLLAAPAPAASATARLYAISIVEHGGFSRIVLESDLPLRFGLFALRSPQRLILELDGVPSRSLLLALPGLVEPDHPLLKGVRIERTPQGRVRVELELREPTEPRIYTVQPDRERGYQIVLDIVPEGRAVTPAPIAFALEEAFLAVSINGQVADTVLALRRSDGRVYLRGEDLRRWRLVLPDQAPLAHQDEGFYPLDALPGLTLRLDEAAQALAIQAPPSLFEATVLEARPAGSATPTPARPGGFFNYDLYAQSAAGRGTGSGLFEAGVFAGSASAVSSFLAPQLEEKRRLVRLETTWRRDRPAELATTRLGDAITAPGIWGRSVRFGGVQWASNFAAQPGLTTFPLPGVSGEAVLPATVDLYINDALRARREVPSGPFTIRDLPVVTGQGEARLVVRDLLGRERVIVQPYYATPRLLRPGLRAYSYELGFVRRQFGAASADYGRFLAAATHRLGITDRFTGELRGELLPGQQTFGTGAALLWPKAGVLSGALAASRSERGTGGLLRLGFERQGRHFAFGGNTEVATRSFAQLGLQPGELSPRRSSQVFASLGLGRYGSVSTSYSSQAFYDRPDIRLLGASYSATVGKLGFLGLSALRVLGPKPDTLLALTFTASLDERTSASANLTSQVGGYQSQLQLQRNLPAGSGFGYRLLAGTGTRDVREAGISAQNDAGTYVLEAADSGGQTALRGSASGGIAVLDGEAFLSRRINDSFGVVRVPGHAGVRIYADNQLVARTGAEGSALVPRLRPYERNAVRVELADLPLDSEVPDLQAAAVPYYRSGMLLEFPVRRSLAAVLTVVLDNGEPLPAGALARVNDEEKEFPVGLNGELYLTDLRPANRVRLVWNGQQCSFGVAYRAGEDPLPHLGTYTCRGMKP